MKVSVSMLENARNAEGLLAKEQANGMGDFLPEGHPLKAVVEKHKEMLGGDLSGLPPGHPLLLELENAKRRMAAKEAGGEDGSAKGTETAREEPRDRLKKARKLEEVKRESRRREDDDNDRRRVAAGAVNKGVEEVVRGLSELSRVLAANEELLATSPFGRTKCERLKRVLAAVERGVSECRMARI